MNSLEPIIGYAKARKESLENQKTRSHHESGIEELRLVIVLCEGLIKQEELLRKALTKEERDEERWSPPKL